MTRSLYDRFSANFDLPQFEFGVPHYRGMLSHLNRETKDIYISYGGQRIAELSPNGDVFLVNIEGQHTNGITGRWETLLGWMLPETSMDRRVSLSTRQLKTAAGVKEMTVFFTVGTRADRNVRWTWERTSWTFSQRLKIWVDNNNMLQAERVEPRLEVQKDNKKYREFCSKLRKLKAVLVAQAKMGVNLDLVNHRYHSHMSECRKLVLEASGRPSDTWIPFATVHKKGYELIDNWVHGSMDAAELRMIAAHLCYSRTSQADAGTADDLIRRVTNGLRDVQVEYLRRHCITISEPSNSSERLSNEYHQDSELLPPSGLREVQVPSEAEVC